MTTEQAKDMIGVVCVDTDTYTETLARAAQNEEKLDCIMRYLRNEELSVYLDVSRIFFGEEAER